MVNCILIFNRKKKKKEAKCWTIESQIVTNCSRATDSIHTSMEERETTENNTDID